MQSSPSRTSGEPAQRSMSATRRPPTTNTVGGAGSSVRKLFVGHSHRSQPVILSNQSNQRLSSSQSSLQSSVYGSRPQSRPMSAGTTLRSRKKTSKSSEGMATSFADRIRNLTMQAQLHPRSNSKPASSKSRRPQSAKFAK